MISIPESKIKKKIDWLIKYMQFSLKFESRKVLGGNFKRNKSEWSEGEFSLATIKKGFYVLSNLSIASHNVRYVISHHQ